jgi:hypothetical protein
MPDDPKPAAPKPDDPKPDDGADPVEELATIGEVIDEAVKRAVGETSKSFFKGLADLLDLGADSSDGGDPPKPGDSPKPADPPTPPVAEPVTPIRSRKWL